MGCATCGKNRRSREAGRRETIYLKCVGCGTLLHGRKKEMKRVDGNLVCGECYKRYTNMTTKPAKEKKTKVAEDGQKQPPKAKKGGDNLDPWKK